MRDCRPDQLELWGSPHEEAIEKIQETFRESGRDAFTLMQKYNLRASEAALSDALKFIRRQPGECVGISELQASLNKAELIDAVEAGRCFCGV